MKTICNIVNLNLKYFIVFSLSILTCTSVRAKNNSFRPILDSAFLYYKNGNYLKALELYHHIENKGYASANMYYNMGNAYFRSHQIAKAILYYERAKLLKPNDPDINHNLKFANTFITDKINELPEPFYITWFRYFTNLIPPNSWAWIALALFLALMILIYINFLSTSLFVTKIIKTIAAFLFVFWLICIVSAYSTYKRTTTHKYAIIISETIETKSSPDENSTSLFVLHEGTKVYIKEVFEDWVEIRIADGNTGWVKEKDLERI